MPKKSTLNVAKVDIVLIFIVNFNVLFLQKCVPSYFCPSYAIKIAKLRQSCGCFCVHNL